jgi:hypothetical protein
VSSKEEKKRKAKKQVVGEKKPKRKHLTIISDFEMDVEPDVPDNALDIVTLGKVKIGGKRVHKNIPPAKMDNISFHSEENAQRWKYAYQSRIAHERELNRETLECEEIIELLEASGLMKTVTKLGKCHETLIKEFIVNITRDCSEGRQELRHVYVRAKHVKFSPSTINKYLGRNDKSLTEKITPLNQVIKEIIGGQVEDWSKKGQLSTRKLSVKYAILNKIGAANWAPTTHGSGITLLLANLIFRIGTKGKLDFREHVFSLTMRHAETFAVILPIAFPCLIT